MTAIDPVSFNQRFDGPHDEDQIRDRALPLDMDGEFDSSPPGSPGEAADSADARRERTVRSPIIVYSPDRMPAFAITDPVVEPHGDASGSPAQARPNLLSGIPEDYARLALTIAATEEVDPNWVLSVMRAENAGFDPGLVSSAGAVGLMQVMPRIGEAFGAKDLTNPEQNIRAGTRFLRILIDKYRNPVLVAAAYNAGEPNVDLRHSLPLIRETADYVTRVVGYYTGTATGPTFPPIDPSSTPAPGSPRRAGPAERARSPMLVFSAAKPIPPDVRPQREEGRRDAGGPVKIIKEEVFE
ncbi:lytic transglycosylase domain-containing protein [Rhizobium mongolense]